MASPANQRNAPCIDLSQPADSGPAINTRAPEWDTAFATLYQATPDLQAWVKGGWGHKAQFAALVAVAFSLVTYAQGKCANYVSAQDNVAAMLNSLLSGWRVGPYAILLRALIRLSSASELLNGSVGEHIKRAISKHDGNLCQHDEPEWEALTARRWLPAIKCSAYLGAALARQHQIRSGRNDGVARF